MKVFVGPHARLSKSGKRVAVDGYWRKVASSKKGSSPGSAISSRAQLPESSGELTEEARDLLKRFIPEHYRDGDRFTNVGWQRYETESGRLYREAVKSVEETHAQHYDPDRKWYTAERAKQWMPILQDVLTAAKRVPKDRKAVIVGGLPGAGKSTSLDRNGITEDKYFRLDSDLIKELMIEHGMAPQIEGMAPMEAAGLIHRESADIMDLVLDKLMRQGTNVVIDGTLSDGAEPFVRQQMADLRELGFGVKGMFIHVSPETSKRRAEQRYRRGMEDFLFRGKGYGGRHIPSRVFEWKPPGRRNSDVFERLRDEFDDWLEYNNDRDGSAAQESGRSSDVVEFSQMEWGEIDE